MKRINNYTFEIDQDISIFFYNNRVAITFYDRDNTRFYREHYYIEEVLKSNALVGGIGADVKDKLTEQNRKFIVKLVKFYTSVFG